jgi:anti-sigma factor RsiW
MSLLTCRDVTGFLLDYLTHDLDPAVRAEFEAHLAVCDACVEYIRSYEAGVRLGQSAFEHPDEAAERQVPSDLVAAILAARRRGVG